MSYGKGQAPALMQQSWNALFWWMRPDKRAYRQLGICRKASFLEEDFSGLIFLHGKITSGFWTAQIWLNAIIRFYDSADDSIGLA
jgi:hypothetical protein